MFSKARLNLSGYWRKDDTRSRLFVQGKGEIRLGKTEFTAQGGEGSVYIKGSKAYKIYKDPARAISLEKIQELSVLDLPNIIRPLDLIIDHKNGVVGYSMKAVGKSHALCQLFPKAFRLRNNITPETVLQLVRRMQAGVTHVHSKGILIVDLNEMNFLVSASFRELFFIDVDSYQTPSFPASVLMESVRDRHAKRFTVDSDWFSFAVISFQMFVGIHPFKGTYQPFQHLSDNMSKLDRRMNENVSILHAGVSVPSSCLPLTVIPRVYLDWYRAVFEEGKRLAPPESTQSVISVAIPIQARIESGSFTLTELRAFDSELIWHDGSISVTRNSVYFDGQKFSKPPFDVKVIVTPRQRHVIAAYNDGGHVKFQDLTTGKPISTEIQGEDVLLANGGLYLKQQENIFLVEFLELPQNILMGLQSVANVMMQSTWLFDGIAFQSLLGAMYASIPTPDGRCYQVHLPELDGSSVIAARLIRSVLVVVVNRAGRYDKLVFCFAKDFSSYSIRTLVDISNTDIEFTVLDRGVVLHLIDDDGLEVFSNSTESSQIRTFQDPAVSGGPKLFRTGSQALLARSNKLYRFQLRQ